MTWLERNERGVAVTLSIGVGTLAGLWLAACTAGRADRTEPRTPPPEDAAAPPPPAIKPPKKRPVRRTPAPPPPRRRAVMRRQPLPRNYVE